nr:hypothetical protein [Halobaculum sp. XH14]
MNYFELAPSESFGYAYHRHSDQEVFYVQSEMTTFEIEIGEVEVGAGEAIRFAPGEFQFASHQPPMRH